MRNKILLVEDNEMIVKGWPVTKREIKLDVHEQIMMNLDLVTQVFINTIGWKVK